ncbi:MAG: hypothetical protein GY730_01485 [bacterium]|nr:hypothetical protein [bacterium]
MKKKSLYLSIILIVIFYFHISTSINKADMQTSSFPKKMIRLKNGATAIHYLPAGFRSEKRYPLIMALHGKGESAESAFRAWQPVADKLGMILVCPNGTDKKEGYSKKPDDKLMLIKLLKLIDHNYKIDFSKSFLTGFSRGGNFAIESGIVHPAKFRNIICIFGFYNDNLTKIILKNKRKRLYKNSTFYFITGNGDPTQKSITKCYKLFKKHGIKCKLKVYDNIKHTYPPGLSSLTKKIQSWAFQKQRKDKRKTKKSL